MAADDRPHNADGKGDAPGDASPRARLARLTRRALRCGRALVWEAAGERRRILATDGPPVPEGTTIPPALTPGHYDDVIRVESPEAAGEAAGFLASLGAASYLAVGSVGSKTFVSALDDAPRVWTDDDVEILRDLADSAASELRTSGALGRLLRTSPSGFYVFNLEEMRPTYINRGVSLELGYDADDILTMREEAVRTLMHPDDMPRFVEHLAELRRLGDDERGSFEFRLKHADGGHRWFLSRESVLRRGSDGSPIEIFGAATNISDLKRTEALLRESKDQFERLAEISPVGIFRTDLAGRCVYANKRWIEISGLPIERARGEGWASALHPDDFPRLRDEWRAAVAALAQFQAEYRFVRPDGRVCWVLGLAVPEFSADGTATGYIGTLTDITAHKEAEEARSREETRYRLATEAAFGVCYEIDLATDRLIANEERIGQLLGYSPGEFEFSTAWWVERLHPEDLPDVVERAQRLEASRAWRYDSEFRVRHRDGSYRWLLDRGIQLRGPEGAVERRVGCVMDVTEQKRAERDLLQKSRRLKILSDTVRHLLSADRPRDFLAKVFEELATDLGLDYYLNYVVTEDGSRLRLDSSRGLTGEAATAFGDLAFGECACGVVAQERAPLVIESPETSTDPRLELARDLGLTAYACFPLMAGERLLGTLAFGSKSRERFAPEEVELLRAVCTQAGLAMERLELLDETRRRAELLRENDRRKDEFLAMLAHELRNPLASIRNAVQLLAIPDLPRVDDDWARDVVDRQVSHLARMIDDLLDVSRITRGKIRIHKTRIDLRSVLERAAESARLAMESKGQALSADFDAAPLPVLGDATRLEQIFVNLLDNANKYSNRGGVVGLTARLDRVRGAVEVRVKDGGVGISAEMLPRIFDLFTQIDASLDRAEGGLGIGLALVKRLVEMHGGTIEATSEGLGKGSEFVVRLPAAPGAAEFAAPSALSLPAPPPAAPPRRRVLVVDDNLDLADGWSRILKKSGFDTFVAHDGREAIDQALARRPDVIVLDIGLPGLSGYEVAERLVRDEGLSDVLLIAATGYGQAESVARSKAAGFHHHLTKPVNVDALIELIRRHGPKDAPG